MGERFFFLVMDECDIENSSSKFPMKLRNYEMVQATDQPLGGGGESAS